MIVYIYTYIYLFIIRIEVYYIRLFILGSLFLIKYLFMYGNKKFKGLCIFFFSECKNVNEIINVVIVIVV